MGGGRRFAAAGVVFWRAIRGFRDKISGQGHARVSNAAHSARDRSAHALELPRFRAALIGDELPS